MTTTYKPLSLSKTVLKAIEYVNTERRQVQMTKQSQKLAKQLVTNKNDAQLLKLELGAGSKKGTDGWITVDMNPGSDMYWDLLQPLPFEYNTIDAIYSSHVLEHFAYSELLTLLQDCYRVLKTGASFSACVPDASIYIKSYSSNQELDTSIYCRYKPAFNYFSKIDLVNYMAYMDGHHKHMFDTENLVGILEKAGFEQVNLREFDPSLDKLERDYQSIYVEATKLSN